MDKLLKQNIERIEIKDEVLEILKNNNISILNDLCNKKKKDLKEIGIEYPVINDMELQLELLGLRFKNSL